MEDQIIYARPGQLLKVHLKETADIIRISFCNTKTDPDLRECAILTGKAHDFGKITKMFQECLRDLIKKSKKTHHSDLSSLFVFFAVNRKLGPKYGILAYVCVKRHHGGLKDIPEDIENIPEINNLIIKKADDILPQGKKDIDEVFEEPGLTDLFISSIEETVQRIVDIRRDFIKNPEKYRLDPLEYQEVFSSLIDADKISSSGLDITDLPNLPHPKIVREHRSKLGE